MTATTPLLRVVVLVSGRGSNLQAISARADAGELPVRIEAVVSDRVDAGALDWARARGIDTSVLVAQDFPDREAYGARSATSSSRTRRTCSCSRASCAS